MNVLLVLIPVSLLLLGVAMWAFAWAVHTGQFDDLERHGIDVLTDGLGSRPASGREP
jgi:cbb3-type cytochrome oxidase maturation protein